MNVSEVMTHGVYTTSPDETVQTAAHIMADLDTGVLAIGEGDRLGDLAREATPEIAGGALSGIAESKADDTLTAERS
jgi:CBS domain-containing protein